MNNYVLNILGILYSAKRHTYTQACMLA